MLWLCVGGASQIGFALQEVEAGGLVGWKRLNFFKQPQSMASALPRCCLPPTSLTMICI